jgi:hypothetical protein
MRALGLVLAVATAGQAWAAQAEPSDPGVVHIFVVGADKNSVGPLVDVFSRRDPNLRLTQVPEFSSADVMAGDDHEGAARVWIEVAVDGHARITITDQRAQRFLVREASLPTWPDELARETIAQVVESSVTALRENQRLGLSRAQIKPVLAARDKPTVQPRRLRHGLGVFYQTQFFSPQVSAAHGPGLRWQATSPLRWGELGLAASVQYIVPQTWTDTSVGVRLQAAAMRLAMGWRHSVHDRVQLSAWLGGGVDAVYVQPQQGSWGAATLEGARWTNVSVLRAEVRAVLVVTKGWGVILAPSLEWDPQRRSYDVAGLDGRAAVVAPYVLRPGLTLGLEWL